MRISTSVLCAVAAALVCGCDGGNGAASGSAGTSGELIYEGETTTTMQSGAVISHKYAYPLSSLEAKPSPYKRFKVRSDAEPVCTITVLWPGESGSPVEEVMKKEEKAGNFRLTLTMTCRTTSDYRVFKGGRLAYGGRELARDDYFLEQRGSSGCVLYPFMAESDEQAAVLAEQFVRKIVVPNEIGDCLYHRAKHAAETGKQVEQ